MKSTLFLLSVVLLGFTAACQSDNTSADAAGTTKLLSRDTAEGVTYTMPQEQLFGPDGTDLTAAAEPPLQQLVEHLKQHQPRQLIVRSYSDNRGDINEALINSQRRAQNVADWLRGQGVSTPIEVQGLGQADPVAPNATREGQPDPAGQAQNRRVEVVVMK